MRAGAGPVEPVPLRAVHPHGDLQVSGTLAELNQRYLQERG